jgi:hypothetical protein
MEEDKPWTELMDALSGYFIQNDIPFDAQKLTNLVPIQVSISTVSTPI